MDAGLYEIGIRSTGSRSSSQCWDGKGWNRANCKLCRNMDCAQRSAGIGFAGHTTRLRQAFRVGHACRDYMSASSLSRGNAGGIDAARKRQGRCGLYAGHWMWRWQVAACTDDSEQAAHNDIPLLHELARFCMSPYSYVVQIMRPGFHWQQGEQERKASA